MLRLRQAELQSQIDDGHGPVGPGRGEAPHHRTEGAMPTDDIQIKRIPAVRVAELTGDGRRLRAGVHRPGHPAALRRARAPGSTGPGVTPVGPAIAYYEDAPDGERSSCTPRCRSRAEPGATHDFTIVDLPEIERAATIVHRGSMDDVMATIQTLARWIDANGYRSAGYNRELYIELRRGPGRVGDRAPGAGPSSRRPPAGGATPPVRHGSVALLCAATTRAIPEKSDGFPSGIAEKQGLGAEHRCKEPVFRAGVEQETAIRSRSSLRFRQYRLDCDHRSQQAKLLTGIL